MASDHGITWLASYPKSGNTWLRCLLEAVRRNGALDINRMGICYGDSGLSVIQAVSPIPVASLGMEGELLLRPAALLNMKAQHHNPFFLKTHFCNLTLDHCPPAIPHHFTRRAVYIVRDPRCVLGSFSKYFDFSLRHAAEEMNNNHAVIGGGQHTLQWISSWSNHVASWTSETKFPMHVVRYEDLLEDTAGELRQILDFLEWDASDELVQKAVEATDISRLQKIEADEGFKENQHPEERGTFFNGSGIDWRSEVGLQWAERIEQDHGKVMRLLGYIDSEKTELTAVS